MDLQLLKPVIRKPPFNLGQYLSICERNYHSLVHLMQTPCLQQWRDPEHEDGIQVEVHNRGKWVIELKLAQKNSLHPEFPPLNLTIRLYHDFHIAEILTFQNRNTPSPGICKKHFRADEKMQQNVFLLQWLHRLMANPASSQP